MKTFSECMWQRQLDRPSMPGANGLDCSCMHYKRTVRKRKTELVECTKTKNTLMEQRLPNMLVG